MDSDSESDSLVKDSDLDSDSAHAGLVTGLVIITQGLIEWYEVVFPPTERILTARGYMVSVLVAD